MSKKIIIASLALVAISSFTLADNAHAYPRSDEGHQRGHYEKYEDGDDKGYHNFHGKGKRQGRNSEYNEERMKKMHAQFEALSAEQKNALDKLTDEHRDKMDPIRTSLAGKKAEYRALMQNSNPNPKDAGDIATEISVLQQKQRDLREEYSDEVKDRFGLDLDFGPRGGRGHGKGGSYCM